MPWRLWRLHETSRSNHQLLSEKVAGCCNNYNPSLSSIYIRQTKLHALIQAVQNSLDLMVIDKSITITASLLSKFISAKSHWEVLNSVNIVNTQNMRCQHCLGHAVYWSQWPWSHAKRIPRCIMHHRRCSCHKMLRFGVLASMNWEDGVPADTSFAGIPVKKI